MSASAAPTGNPCFACGETDDRRSRSTGADVDSLEVVAGVASAFLLLFQVWLTRTLWRNEAYGREQKLAQTKLVWLVPFIGAVIVAIMHVEVRSEERTKRHG